MIAMVHAFFLLLLGMNNRVAAYSFSLSRKDRYPRNAHGFMRTPISNLAFSKTNFDNAAAGRSLVEAGELISQAACILPNWNSSKEGLSGESPAVFGSAGTALMQAGHSLPRNCADSVCDLFAAACALEPIGLGDPMEAAAEALETAVQETNQQCLMEAAEALEQSAQLFIEYGKALDAEEHQSDHDWETAGGRLQSAAARLQAAAQSFRQIRL